jgi:hypothetical protein
MADDPEHDIFETPDFAKIEANLAESESQRAAVMVHIGNLLVNWGNNEGLMIRILHELLGCSVESSQIIFATLKITQSRIELIRRLSVQNTEGEVRAKLLKLCDRFMSLTRTRNEIAHSMWHFDNKGYIRGSFNIRITSHFEQNKILDTKDISQARLNEIQNVAKQLVKFNRDVWAFFPELHQYMLKPPQERLEKHDQSHPSP